MLHFIYNKDTVCVLVSHDVTTGDFVLQVPYYPPIETLDDFRQDASRCLKIVRDACLDGPTKCDVDLIDVNAWRMEAVVAE